MTKKLTYCLLIALCLGHCISAQQFGIPNGQKYQKVKFKLINNLMVIPVEVNDAKLSFIVDSGVSNPILFNLSDQDSVQINNVSEITLKGLGEGEPMKALQSKGNTFKIGNAVNRYQTLYVVLDKDLNFSTSLGIPVHGILGYQLFRDFIVEINYGSQVLKLYDPQRYSQKKHKRSQTLPLDIINRKAYIDAAVLIDGDREVPVKLLVDTGSSDAVWLFHDPENGIDIPDKNYEDYLGKGLNGHIFGKRTKVNGVRIGDFALKDAKAAFPYMKSFNSIKNLGNRNGSVGAEILKRFNIVFDYTRNEITLKKNGNFKAPFQYNLAGVELQHNGVRYIAERITDSQGIVKNDDGPTGNVQILFENRTRLSLVPEIVVSAIRAGSPAEEAGLRQGDVILAVNGKRVHRYKLQEILKMLNEKEGKRIRVLIERSNRDLTFSFILKKLF